MDEILTQEEDGRFALGDRVLHCGDRIEVFACARLTKARVAENVWLVGHVEHNRDGYYFCNPSGPSFPLVDGMTARLPPED